MTKSQENKPTTLRYGPVQIAIWRNEAKEGGKSFSTATIVKRYVKDGEWADSHSLTKPDIILAIHGLRQALNYME